MGWWWWKHKTYLVEGEKKFLSLFFIPQSFFFKKLAFSSQGNLSQSSWFHSLLPPFNVKIASFGNKGTFCSAFGFCPSHRDPPFSPVSVNPISAIERNYVSWRRLVELTHLGSIIMQLKNVLLYFGRVGGIGGC